MAEEGGHSFLRSKSFDSKAIVVLGTQWGDEGKGKVVDLLCQDADLVCRCQGGNNAGHTVVVDGVMYDFHLLPSGLLNPKCMNLIGNGVVIHLPGLFDEIKKNEQKGLTDWKERLIISSRAHLVFDLHQEADAMEEVGKGTNQIGTTKKGIGPAYSSKAARIGIRVADLVYDFDIFTEKFKRLVDHFQRMHPKLSVDLEVELGKYKTYRDLLKPLVKDSVTYMDKALSQPGNRIIIEGANATMLDIDFGTYPMVTSSNCSAGGVFTGLGIPPNAVGRIYGVAKAYVTRVGRGCFPTEMDPVMDERVRVKGQEYGTTTKRPRRCGWFDAFLMQYVHKINGFSALALTKLDVLDDIEEVKIGVAYKVNGKVINYYPASLDELQNVEVEYLTLPGWKTCTSEIRTFEDLPEAAKKYVLKIEELCRIPVKWVGVGKSRDAIIVRNVNEN